MSTDMGNVVKVARYHLVDRVTYVALPWSVLAFTFLVNVVLFAVIPHERGGAHTGALASMYVFLFICGLSSVVRALPFGLALGVSRRTYSLGTGLLAVSLAATYGLALTVLQILERASGGWGVTMHFFRVPWILDGAWYLTWLTSFVGLALLFAYGAWFGLVYRRWNVPGLVAFVAAQVTVVLVGVLASTWAHGWPAIGHFFSTLSAPGVTGLLAALAAVLATGGFATVRRMAV